MAKIVLSLFRYIKNNKIFHTFFVICFMRFIFFRFSPLQLLQPANCICNEQRIREVRHVLQLFSTLKDRGLVEIQRKMAAKFSKFWRDAMINPTFILR